jgi:hypothetical protein
MQIRFVENRCDLGAAVYMDGAKNVLIEDATFSHGAGRLGGSVFMTRSSEVDIVNASFYDNNAHTSGGSVYLDESNSHIAMTSSSFMRNTASTGGKYSCARVYTRVLSIISPMFMTILSLLVLFLVLVGVLFHSLQRRFTCFGPTRI